MWVFFFKMSLYRVLFWMEDIGNLFKRYEVLIIYFFVSKDLIFVVYMFLNNVDW